jgi:hypothetical protein
MRFHAVGNHATGGPTHFHAEEPAAVDWVNRWYKPLATQRQLMTALEGAPDGSFYVCNDKNADKVYHIVYKYQNQVFSEEEEEEKKEEQKKKKEKRLPL